MFATQAPLPQYFEIEGDPLDAGYLYFGVASQNPATNPITVYWDLAGTQPVAQPVRTLNGYAARNGTPAQIYANSDYSLSVLSKKGQLVLYADTSLAFNNAGALQTNLADTANLLNGVSLVGGAGRVINSIAVLRTLPKTGAKTAFVLGYYAPSDGGGGVYWYDSTDVVSADNGGTVIVAADGGRWKLSYQEFISVKQFGAKGDGVTADHVAIQAASDLGVTTYFPKPTSYYKTTVAINVRGSCHWLGEISASTIIRNTTGGGAAVITCDSTGSLGPYVFEHLRIGGIGSIGITATLTSFNGTIAGTALTVNSGLVGGIEIGGTVTGAGVTAGTVILSGAGTNWVVNNAQAVGPIVMTMANQYVVKLTMRHVHFEGDLLTGVDADLIFANWQDCGFGIYTQTSYNANFTCFKSNGNGTLNANLNVLQRCQFYGSTAAYAIQLASGGLWRLIDCDWEGNVRNLTTSNISGLVIDNGYTERVGAATGQAFDFGLSRTRVKVLGGIYNGGSMTAGVSMFGATATCQLLVEDADISTSAGGFAYINTTAISHAPAPTGVHHFKDNRVQGNAADPLLWMDNLLEGTIYAWTPVPTNLTIVNNSGLPTYTGQYWFVGRQCFFTIKISVPGTSTTASTANSTFFLPPNASMPIANSTSTLSVTDESLTGTSLGVGCIYSGNGRLFTPTWAARAGNIGISGSFLF